MTDVQPDEGALDDGQLAVVVFPSGAAGQLLVQPAQAAARAVPYRVVWVTVAAAGAGQVFGSASLNAAPCRSGRPLVPGRRGAGKYITRSLRSRPSTSTGRPASSQASLVRS